MQFCNNWLCDIICRNKSMFFKNMLFKFFLYVFILFICKQLCNDNFTIIAVKESLKKKEKQCSNNIVFLFFFYLFLYLILILIVVNVAHIHFWIDQYFFHSFDIRLLIGMITWPSSSKKNPRSVPRLQYFPYGAFNACCSIWVFWLASRQCWGWCVVFNEKTRSDTGDALVLRQPPSIVRARMLIVLFHGEIWSFIHGTRRDLRMEWRSLRAAARWEYRNASHFMRLTSTWSPRERFLRPTNLHID